MIELDVDVDLIVLLYNTEGEVEWWECADGWIVGTLLAVVVYIGVVCSGTLCDAVVVVPEGTLAACAIGSQ